MNLQSVVKTLCLLGVATASSALPLATAHADYVVTPNAYVDQLGGAETSGPFRRDDGGGANTFQWVIAASEFGALLPASEITGIGFRGSLQFPLPLVDQFYADWELTLSTSLNPPGSLSTVFAENIAPDAVVVKDGPFTLPTHALAVGSPPPFFNIPFTSPFTYTGGDLLVTLRNTGGPGGASIPIDGRAYSAAEPVEVNGGAPNDATIGETGYFHYPITRFEYQRVPEPTTLRLVGITMVGLGYMRRR